MWNCNWLNQDRTVELQAIAAGLKKIVWLSNQSPNLHMGCHIQQRPSWCCIRCWNSGVTRKISFLQFSNAFVRYSPAAASKPSSTDGFGSRITNWGQCCQATCWIASTSASTPDAAELPADGQHVFGMHAAFPLQDMNWQSRLSLPGKTQTLVSMNL